MMQVAILTGGLATRLGSITKDCPKSMVRIEGRTFLEFQLDFLKKGGVEDIVLCTGHLGEQIEDYFGDGRQYGVSIRYSHEDKPLGTAGALKKAEPFLEDAFFTIYGDSFVSLDFGRTMSFFNLQNKLALMTVYKNYNRFDKSNTEIDGNLVKRFSKKEKTSQTIYVEHGVNIFRKQVLNMIPANEFYSLDDLFPRLIEQQELLAFEVNERFYTIGSIQGLKEFEYLVGGGVK
jgi:N-acetyl-alpha-D-muramate 1-phosphate uridylyltransferase